jgi:hypothetical protein
LGSEFPTIVFFIVVSCIYLIEKLFSIEAASYFYYELIIKSMYWFIQ